MKVAQKSIEAAPMCSAYTSTVGSLNLAVLKMDYEYVW